MKRELSAWTVVGLVALGVMQWPSAPVEGQAPQGQSSGPAAAPNPRWPGKVYISGENPGITLREKAGAPVLAQVSYWRIHWSPVGTGHVCYVTTGEGKSPNDLRVALHDNQKLYEYLTNQMMSVFNQSFKDRPFTPIGGATFGRSGDAITEYREVCNSDKYKVELTWRSLGEPHLLSREPGRPDNPFGLVFLNIPSSQAEISINGRKQPGGVHPTPAGTGGALLAFGETWRRIE